VNLLHEVVGQNVPCMASLEDIQSAAVHGMKQTVAVCLAIVCRIRLAFFLSQPRSNKHGRNTVATKRQFTAANCIKR